jgi:hypothetical protein
VASAGTRAVPSKVPQPVALSNRARPANNRAPCVTRRESGEGTAPWRNPSIHGLSQARGK